MLQTEKTFFRFRIDVNLFKFIANLFLYILFLENKVLRKGDQIWDTLQTRLTSRCSQPKDINWITMTRHMTVMLLVHNGHNFLLELHSTFIPLNSVQNYNSRLRDFCLTNFNYSWLLENLPKNNEKFVKRNALAEFLWDFQIY